jgi:phage gpG-like protein
MADTPEDLSDGARQLLEKIVEAAEEMLRQGASRIGAIAVSEYMRDAGKAAGRGDVTLGPNQTDTLRIVTGRLARSLTGARTDRAAPESINRVRRVTSTAVRLIKGSRVPYAEVHEEGFRGSVDVRPHRRTMTQGFGPDSAYPQDVVVTRHTRQMDIPARPYLGPATEDWKEELQEAAPPVLREAIRQAMDID